MIEERVGEIVCVCVCVCVCISVLFASMQLCQLSKIMVHTQYTTCY